MRRHSRSAWFRSRFARAGAIVLAPRPADIIVRCGSGVHRVRLVRGRFWASARCRACGSRVDATRVRRLARWTANACRPAGRDPRRLGTWVATLAYVMLAGTGIVCVWLLADHWWLATTLLFGPRWVLLLPAATLIPAALRWDRPLLVPLALATVAIVGPVMGLCTGWRRLLVSGDAAHDVRVMSFNVDGGNSLRLPLEEMLRDWNLDVAAFQECGGSLKAAMETLREWHTDIRGSLCLVSRFPILERTEMAHTELTDAGGSGLVQTDALDVGGRVVHFTNVHLETPRAGFEELRAGRLSEGVPKLEGKSLLREIEQRRARRWVDRYAAPRITVGDFNSPPESPIFRAAWADWQNAFSRTGRGFGGTRLNGWIRARIDHILLDDRWTVVRSWLGPDVGSDHRPILAEVRLR
jgi:vancomycin resistance protein VanJ